MAKLSPIFTLEMKLKEQVMTEEVKKALPQEFNDWNVHDLAKRIRDQMNLLQWIPFTLTEKTESELDQLPSLADFEIKYLKLTRENLILKINGGVKPRVVGLENDLNELTSAFVACFERNWPRNLVESVFLGGIIGIYISKVILYVTINMIIMWKIGPEVRVNLLLHEWNPHFLTEFDHGLCDFTTISLLDSIHTCE